MVAALIVFATIYWVSQKIKGAVVIPEEQPASSPALNLQFQNSPSPAPSAKSVKEYRQFPGEFSPAELTNKKAIIQTSKGQIELEIYPEASKAASNFIFLSKDGFYDGLIFHRVEDWVIQGGDPLGNGTGGPGYKFADEPVTKPYLRGTLAMANSGPNTNGSQFFILKRDTPLQPKYTIFGKVISGLEVIDQIKAGDVMQKITITPLK
ncbi:MAG: peptidylprolyl isomerase [Candidatus Daviesbacteria bacterium]|nr:MAG: peptidylprolyl isomerase [Candidatus Daviesbacteria bacterium]